jgi:hypothetical protein
MPYISYTHCILTQHMTVNGARLLPAILSPLDYIKTIGLPGCSTKTDSNAPNQTLNASSSNSKGEQDHICLDMDCSRVWMRPNSPFHLRKEHAMDAISCAWLVAFCNKKWTLGINDKVGLVLGCICPRLEEHNIYPNK